MRERIGGFVYVLCVWTSLLLGCGPELAYAERLALVIGNDSYTRVERLRNARADARAMGGALERAGFTVYLAQDQDRAGMKRVLRQFRQKLGESDDVVVFYAGHGVEVAGSNFLLPVDIQVDDEDHLKDDAIGLQELLDGLQERRPRFTLVIVDACRDNPLRGLGRGFGERGLKPVTAATGQMVIYSAGAGQKALDRLSANDDSPNGLFTRVFVQEMLKPGEPVQLTVARVRREVSRLAAVAGRVQVPALYDQSVGEFSFVDGVASRDDVNPLSGRPDSPEERDEAFWREVRSLNTARGYLAYRERFPDGRYAALAGAAFDKLEREAYDAALATRGTQGLLSFLAEYPASARRSAAEAELERRRSEGSLPLPRPGAVPPAPRANDAPKRATASDADSAPQTSWPPRISAPDLPGGQKVDQAALDAYGLGVARHIGESRRDYPLRARRLRQQGTAEVIVTLGADGKVKDIAVSRSSGHRLLDEEAVERVRSVLPLPKAPPDLRGREYRIQFPISFKLVDEPVDLCVPGQDGKVQSFKCLLPSFFW